MESALAVASQYPIVPFHSRKASRLRYAVAQGWFEEMLYLECTFSIPVKTCWYGGFYGDQCVGWMVLTIGEDLDGLKEDIQVLLHFVRPRSKILR